VYLNPRNRVGATRSSKFAVICIIPLVLKQNTADIKRMLKFLCITLLTLSLGLTGCNTKERYARNNAAARGWLAANPASGHIRVAGKWKPDDEGWGNAQLQQTGTRITGTIGLYTIEGHVKGEDVYLVMSEAGWAYYSAVLKKKGDLLSGFYSAHVPFNTRDQETFVLTRLKN
jgi:hypothetical protein